MPGFCYTESETNIKRSWSSLVCIRRHGLENWTWGLGGFAFGRPHTGTWDIGMSLGWLTLQHWKGTWKHPKKEGIGWDWGVNTCRAKNLLGRSGEWNLAIHKKVPWCFPMFFPLPCDEKELKQALLFTWHHVRVCSIGVWCLCFPLFLVYKWSFLRVFQRRPSRRHSLLFEPYKKERVAKMTMTSITKPL